MRALARKHNVTVPELAPLAEKMASQLAALDDGEAGLKKLAAQARAARAAYVTAAEAQAAARRKGAARLDKAVSAELGPLKLDKAKFVTELVALPESEWSEAGTDRVQFTVSTNPGAPPAPIAKIASGGELSRFLLALKVCLAKVGDVATIVFDEVDSGIGGATAAAVGERLKRLAMDVQVLVVTHSPQVAAIADRHWLIRKTTTRNAASTDVLSLDANGRREEIARMLSGAEVTAEARAAADRLLATAQGDTQCRRPQRCHHAPMSQSARAADGACARAFGQDRLSWTRSGFLAITMMLEHRAGKQSARATLNRCVNRPPVWGRKLTPLWATFS